MAEYIFNDKIEKTDLRGRFAAHSAGIYAMPAPASTQAQSVMKKRNLNMQSHVAKRVEEKDMDEAALVLCMGRTHAENLKEHYCAYADKIHRLSSYVGEERDVEDPYGANEERYEQTARQLETYIDSVIEKLKGNEKNENSNRQ